MLFSPEEINTRKESGETSADKKSVKLRKYLKKHYMAIENIRELTRLPDFDEIYFIWTLRSFNAFSFIQFIISEQDRIDYLCIASYNMARLVIEALMHLVDEQAILELYIVLSDAAKSRFPQTYDLANLEANRRHNVTVNYTWNHAKVALARCGDNYFILEGSGNFADNSRHEQYVFTNDPVAFEFRKTWIIDEII